MNDLSVYLPALMTAWSATLLALMSPGPNIMAVIATSIGVGRASGAALAVGVSCGSLLWASVAVLGLTALLTAYASVLMVVRIAGGCYLVWLGYQALKSAFTPKELSVAKLSGKLCLKRFFLRGLGVQMTNPKAALVMAAIVSIGVHDEATVWVNASLVAGIALISLLGHLVYALAFSTKAVTRVYLKCRAALECAFGVFFIFAGLKLLSGRD